MDGAMSTDKPLHVRVAVALGMLCEPCSSDGGCPEWTEIPSTDWGEDCQNGHIPRYDTDWSATGPLIEKFGITVTPGSCLGLFKSPWVAARNFVAECDGWASEEDAAGPTPHLAICNLILALKAAGKLEQA
jgi:hypothetical protein